MDNSSERLERILALLLLQSMKDASQMEKATKLNIAGFSNVEIAEYLEIAPATVGVMIHRISKAKKKTKTKQSK